MPEDDFDLLKMRGKVIQESLPTDFSKRIRACLAEHYNWGEYGPENSLRKCVLSETGGEERLPIKRIVVVGASCAGKSTFRNRLIAPTEKEAEIQHGPFFSDDEDLDAKQQPVVTAPIIKAAKKPVGVPTVKVLREKGFELAIVIERKPAKRDFCLVCQRDMSLDEAREELEFGLKEQARAIEEFKKEGLPFIHYISHE